MKRVYLVQHAEAFDKDENPGRPLTPEGTENIEKVTKFLHPLGLKIDNIYHSGKTRAEQTAAIIAKNMKEGYETEERDDLGPVDDVSSVADEVRKSDEISCFVGHLPYMEKITGYLITGNEENKVVDFTNGGVVCLVDSGDGFFVDWIVTPDVVPSS